MTKCSLFWKKVAQFKENDDFKGFCVWCREAEACEGKSCRDCKEYSQTHRDWKTIDVFKLIAKKTKQDVCGVFQMENISEGALRPIVDAPNVIQEKAVDVLLPQIIAGERISQNDSKKAVEQAKGNKSEKHIFKPKVFTVWNFSKCDKRFGTPNFPSQIPGQVIQNILHYFTQEGDLVVDPMAGGGTTIDVCREMKRSCLAYDLAPIREDVTRLDIREGFPQKTKGCDLIFLDPPYFKKMNKSYAKDSVSSLTREQFLVFMGKLAKDCFETVKNFGVVALLISDFIDYDKSLLSCEYYNLFVNAGFTAVNRIQTPLSTQEYNNPQQKKALEKKQLLNISRDLYIFRKF